MDNATLIATNLRSNSMKIEENEKNRENIAACMLAEAILGIGCLGNDTRKDYHLPYNSEKQKRLKLEVEQALESLRDYEKLVIRSRFGFDGERKTYDQLAAEMNIDKEKVRDVEAMAIRKLRYPGRSKKLKNIIYDEYSLNCENKTDDFISVLNGIIFMWFIAFVILSLKRFSMIFFAIVIWIIMLIYNTIWYLKKRKSDGKER